MNKPQRNTEDFSIKTVLFVAVIWIKKRNQVKRSEAAEVNFCLTSSPCWFYYMAKDPCTVASVFTPSCTGGENYIHLKVAQYLNTVGIKQCVAFSWYENIWSVNNSTVPEAFLVSSYGIQTTKNEHLRLKFLKYVYLF